MKKWIYDRVSIQGDRYGTSVEVTVQLVLVEDVSTQKEERVTLSIALSLGRGYSVGGFSKIQELLEKRVQEITGLPVEWVRDVTSKNTEPGV